MSQKSRIREHLEAGRPITPLDALTLYGCFRLAAIIHVLRVKEHMDIETDLTNKYATYKLL